MTDYVKPLPLADSDTRPYWEGTKEHEIRVQRCVDCNNLRWTPQALCPHCYSWKAEWTSLPLTGTVASYVVVQQATVRSFADDVPYVLVRVVIDDTDGAVVLTSTLSDIDWEDVKVGMRAMVYFDDVTPEVTLPRFRPI